MNPTSQLRRFRLRRALTVTLLVVPMLFPALRASAEFEISVLIEDGGDGHLSRAEILSGVFVSGTANPKYMVEVVVDDTETTTPPVIRRIEAHETNGTWRTERLDLTSFKDGEVTAKAREIGLASLTVQATPDTPPVTVEATPDLSDEVSYTSIKDTVIPSTTLSVTQATNGYFNRYVQGLMPRASGKASKPGADITLTVEPTGGLPSATVVKADAAGFWSHRLPRIDSWSEGPVRFTAKGSDAAGNPSPTETLVVVKDTIRPGLTLSFTSPSPIGPTGTRTVALGGTTEPGSRVHLSIDDANPATVPVEVSSAPAAANGTWSVSGVDVRTLHDGTLTATGRAVDRAGNSSDDAAATIQRAAGTPPAQVEIEFLSSVAHHSNAEDSNGGRALRLLVTLDPAMPDADYPVTVVVDDSDPSTPAATSTKLLSPESSRNLRTFALDVRGLKEGAVTAIAYLDDGPAPGEGNRSRSVPVTSKLDLTAPATVWKTANQASFYSRNFAVYTYNTVVLEGSSKDDPGTSNLQFVVLKGTRAGGGTFTHVAPRTTRDAPVSAWKLSGIAFDPGTWTVTAQAQDEAGNLEPVSAANTITIVVG
ncbi:MAG TPA: hypothetical protein VM840_00790 [Actinomycetota bacterium]|nr:hypothetical protein [Actinomycetota bacterium]